MRSEFRKNSDILAISKTNNTPVHIVGGYSMRRADMPEGQVMNVRANPVDEEFVKASGLTLLVGQDFNHQDYVNANNDDYEKNKYQYIINETAAKALGWTPEEAIGKKMVLNAPGEVKGVIKDFHFASLHNPVEPLVLFCGSWGNTLIVKTSGKNLGSTISFMEKKWKEIAPHRPFEYRFMDEDFQKLYSAESRIGNVFTIFAGIAILLACLGLFGLSVFTAQQRIKETGIRRVLGASVSGLTVLLSARFVVLVIVAFVLASPIAWFVMNKWLQDFAYRIDISWWIFGVAALSVLAITVITVGLQAIKAAIANPVKSLRTE